MKTTMHQLEDLLKALPNAEKALKQLQAPEPDCEDFNLYPISVDEVLSHESFVTIPIHYLPNQRRD